MNNNNTIAIIYNAAHHVLLFKSELIRSIKKNGYRVVVLASKDNYSEKLLDIVDEYYEIKLDSSGINPVKDAYLIFQIYNICKGLKLAVILNFTIKPWVISIRCFTLTYFNFNIKIFHNSQKKG